MTIGFMAEMPKEKYNSSSFLDKLFVGSRTVRIHGLDLCFCWFSLMNTFIWSNVSEIPGHQVEVALDFVLHILILLCIHCVDSDKPLFQLPEPPFPIDK